MILLPILVLSFLPGIPLAGMLLRRPFPAFAFLAIAGVVGLLWSTSGTLLLAFLHVPFTRMAVTTLCALPAIFVTVIPSARRVLQVQLRALPWNLRDIVIVAGVAVVLLTPLVVVRDGLPTGDVQKAMYWGSRILSHPGLPNYGEAANLNRDPVDFLTPGLHTLTAAVLAFPGDPYRNIALFSWGVSLFLAGLAAALSSLLTRSAVAPLLAFLFTALNIRFLRYAFTPGYHYQNLVGEVFLLLGLIMLLLLERRGALRVHAGRAVLGLASLAVLPFVHQFTAFVALPLVGVALIIRLIRARRSIRVVWSHLSLGIRRVTVALSFIVLLGLAGLRLPTIQEKLPHLITTSPHLRETLVPLSAYPLLLGPALVFLGLGGLLSALAMRRRHTLPTRAPGATGLPVMGMAPVRGSAPRASDEEPSSREVPRACAWGSTAVPVLAAWLLLLLLLGQGPRFFLDIPSARTLLYAIVPLAVFASFLVSHALATVLPGRWSTVQTLFLLALPLAAAGQGIAVELSRLDTDTRVNSSLTSEELRLLTILWEHSPTCTPAQAAGTVPCADRVLVDDWNRRRLTWLILSPYHMVTRVGGDLRTIAEESRQSPLRAALYAQHLDFEKIFELGNYPLAGQLARRLGIRFIATATGITDDLFAANPDATTMERSSGATLYEISLPEHAVHQAPLEEFLLAPTTLANDVGDREDVLPHSAVSIAASRITDPQREGQMTSRTIGSETSTLRVNVGSYVQPLWDPDGDARIDVPLRLVLLLVGTGGRITIRGTDGTDQHTTIPQTRRIETAMLDFPGGSQILDERGFLTITMNSTTPLTIDLLAIGPPVRSASRDDAGSSLATP